MWLRMVGFAVGSALLVACTGTKSFPENGPETFAGLTDHRTAVTTDTGIDCGTYLRDQGENLPEAAATCLISAVTAEKPVRLRESYPTVEGDPILVTYTSKGTGGEIDVSTDYTKDRFGSGTVGHDTCTGPTYEQEQLRFENCL